MLYEPLPHVVEEGRGRAVRGQTTQAGMQDSHHRALRRRYFQDAITLSKQSQDLPLGQ